MNLQRLWCVLAIISFSMPVFAATPYQIDSLDDFNNMVEGPNWVETTGGSYASYVEQVLEGAPNEVYEGDGSMKFDFPSYVSGERDDEVIRTFSPALNFSNYEALAITLWVWTLDPTDTLPQSVGLRDSRLKEIILDDGSARIGRFSVPHLKNIGWNKVIAPLRNFAWKVGINEVDPCDVDWDDITKIRLFARTEDPAPPANADNNEIYIDDLQLEWAPNEPSRPYQMASFDDIWDELWYEDHGNTLMLQTPPGDANYIEHGFINFYDFALYVGNYTGDMNDFAGFTDIWLEEDVEVNNVYNLFTADHPGGSMMMDFNSHGESDWDITVVMPLIPALDFTDGNDWAITVWVWSDLVLDAYLWEITLHDVCGNTGRSRVPRADIVTGYGWNKIIVRIDELLWSDGGNFANKTSDEVCLDAIARIELWSMTYPFWGHNTYLDDLRIEPAVEAISEAVVYDANYGTITVDGNAIDWAGLSDQIDFDLATINWTEPSGPNFPPTPAPGQWNHTGSGDLHVKYRLAWDYTYLYILIEEQSGDLTATEAPDQSYFDDGGFDYFGTYYDALALAFDFTNNRIPGVNTMMGLWLYLGLSSGDPDPCDPGRSDLMIALLNTLRGVHNDAPLVNGSVATSGDLGSRVIEAKLKWSVLESAIDTWFQPAGGIEAAVGPGYMFGCDPRLLDTEDTDSPWSPTHGMGWLSGIDYGVGWPQGYHRWPTGRDTYSIDIRLVN